MLTINNTLDGYLKDVEIKGNTVQDPDNLADIRSVGDKVEGQELYEIPVLSRGKNLWTYTFEDGTIDANTGAFTNNNFGIRSTYIRINFDTFTISGLNNLARSFVAYYDKNKKYISRTSGEIRDNITVTEIPNNAYYFVLTLFAFSDETLKNNTKNTIKIQIEEGTVATPYEPYIEDKLTILSPTPLEKVGDVADRIIEKDGVWGVEKNIKSRLLGNENWYYDSNLKRFQVKLDDVQSLAFGKLISNAYIYANDGREDKNMMTHLSNIYIIEHSCTTSNEFNKHLRDNNVFIKYATNTPQFISLPHDQQVKLRTFANKTNISFLTEIEGTIKAQVPKSLGATVNTHTEQINNLNKELDRVKKLEESTVSTVTTESDFTTVEATSNGYFEDVKLEGKTLVNLFDKNKPWTQGKHDGVEGKNLYMQYEVNKSSNNTYHIIAPIGDKTSNWDDARVMIYAYNIVTNTTSKLILDKALNSNDSINRVITLTNDEVLLFNCWDISEDKFNKNYPTMMILEGDHTQNPPSYFEGLKSVGQDVDEIVVSSVNENLVLNCSFHEQNQFNHAIKINDIKTKNLRVSNPFGKKIALVIFNYNTNNWVRDIEVLPNTFINIELNLEECVRFINFPKVVWSGNNDYVSLAKHIIIGTDRLNIDKKRLLYYNNETQTWEKPILREWDSIEKHANGKYYYHQRSLEAYFDGDENWGEFPKPFENTMAFQLHMPLVKHTTDVGIVADKIQGVSYLKVNSEDVEGISLWDSQSFIRFRINKSKLPTQDVAGFKQWLQANNVTVVYQLAQEKVYECTNIDLITYANETNFIVESGVLSPRTTLKVHSNISNVVSLLQKKVSLLESNMTKYMITQNRLQLSSTHSADSVTFKVDYTVCSENMSQENYDTDLYNLILNNILVGKDNYDYDHMFNIIMDYASWSQISWDQFDILVGLMDIQHNPPIEEIPTDDEIVEEIPNEIM